MGAIVIKSNSEENLKLLAALASKLGEKVKAIEDEDFEDFAFGILMKQSKTGKTVGRGTIMKKLQAQS